MAEAAPTGTGKPVLVTGAGGFIGRDLVRQLLERGYPVRAMVRSLDGARFAAHERLQLVRADMRDADSLAAAAAGCGAVIHLAAAKSDERDSEDINVGGAQRLVRACEQARCRRLVNVSTLSTKIARQGAYARTKLAADRVFEASGLEVTTLLPSVVYGEAGGGVFGTILQFVRGHSLVPVLGNGRWVSAPVYVGDVSSAAIACLDKPVTIGRSYDIAGPEAISFDDLIDRLGAAVGRRATKVHVPFAVGLAIAHLVSRLPKAPITVSNVLGSNQDTRIDIAPARRDIGFDPLHLDAGMALVVPAPPVANGADPRWAADCRLITRYLIDRDPGADVVERFVAAMALKFSRTDLDDSEWRFVRRHPRTLPFVDAAAGLLQPASPLRQRVFLALALLETAPQHADQFLPRVRPTGMLVLELVWLAFASALKALLGLPLLAWARRAG